MIFNPYSDDNNDSLRFYVAYPDVSIEIYPLDFTRIVIECEEGCPTYGLLHGYQDRSFLECHILKYNQNMDEKPLGIYIKDTTSRLTIKDLPLIFNLWRKYGLDSFLIIKRVWMRHYIYETKLDGIPTKLKVVNIEKEVI